jgi:glycine dehydrogenase
MKPDGQAVGRSQAADPGRLVGVLIAAERCCCMEAGASIEGLASLAKYWSPVNRVDDVHGDRNLVCICPSPDEYREDAA